MMRDTPRENYFDQFMRLPQNERNNLFKQYQKSFLDFDNDIIVNSAALALRSLGLPRNELKTLQVGPTPRTAPWSLAEQLLDKLKKEDSNTPYIILSIVTNGGRHSVGAVIDTVNKKIHCIDSLKDWGIDEAHDQLAEAIERVPQLAGYEILTPPSTCPRQQSDQITCGIHSSANIVGIIRHLEIQKGRLPADEKKGHPSSQLLRNTNIDISKGTGITERTTDEINSYTGIFCLAYRDYGIERENEIANPRLNARQKKTLRFAFQELAQNAELKKNEDLTNLIAALNKDTPPGSDPEDTQSIEGRSLNDFTRAFKVSNPNNAFIPFLEDRAILAALPQNMADKVAEKEALVKKQIQSKLTRPDEKKSSLGKAEKSGDIKVAAAAQGINGNINLYEQNIEFKNCSTIGDLRRFVVDDLKSKGLDISPHVLVFISSGARMSDSTTLKEIEGRGEKIGEGALHIGTQSLTDAQRLQLKQLNQPQQQAKSGATGQQPTAKATTLSGIGVTFGFRGSKKEEPVLSREEKITNMIAEAKKAGFQLSRAQADQSLKVEEDAKKRPSAGKSSH